MTEVVVLSGKGGVGKSSIAASLGSLLSAKHKVLMADTDVDTPNLHLIFGATLTKSDEIEASEKAFINYDKCSGCMMCVDACQFSSIIDGEEPIIIPYSCEGCGACAIMCPEDAINIERVVSGKINTYDARNVLIISGELHIGESGSGLIVDRVKRRAQEAAEESNAEMIITDGPPGIGCPVISSIKGSDYALVVTEPTPAALSDLRRVVEVINYFKIPLGIVINKSDIHAKTKAAIRAFGKDKGFPVLLEIPYDKSVPMAIAMAKPVVTQYPDAASSMALGRLANKLTEIFHQ